MVALHKEIEFENDISHHLAANGWLYAEGDAKGYDSPRALFPADVVTWVQDSQPEAWAAIVKAHGANAEVTLLVGADQARLQERLYQQIQSLNFWCS